MSTSTSTFHHPLTLINSTTTTATISHNSSSNSPYHAYHNQRTGSGNGSSTPLIATLISVELVSMAPLYAVSLYVVRVMCTTSILHRNLRLLFAWHALAAMSFGAGRAHIGVVNLRILDTPKFPYPGSVLDGFLANLGICANMYVTPAQVLERIMATRAVDSYERCQSGHYSLYTMMLLTLLMSVAMAWRNMTTRMQGQATANPAVMATGVLNTAAGVAAYLILLAVLRHNERSYKEEQHNRSGHVSLSKRYQRSENIRATRQLLPVTLLHVLQNIPPGIFLSMCWVGVVRTPREYAIYSRIASIPLCWFYLALQITIIASHPTLRREATTQLHRFWLCCRALGGCMFPGNRIAPVNADKNLVATNDDGDGSERKSGRGSENRVLVLKSIVDGRELLPRLGVNQQEEHFKNLTDFWAAEWLPTSRGGGEEKRGPYFKLTLNTDQK